jgi:hypothetical protein
MTEAKKSLKLVAPKGPTIGKRVLAKPAPAWIENMATTRIRKAENIK